MAFYFEYVYDLEYVQSKEDHQAIHQDPEDGEWHRLAHDITILTLHIAGGGSDGYRLW